MESELVSVWPETKFNTILSASWRIVSPSRQYLPISYASQRGKLDGFTPTRSTRTDEDFSDSSKLTSIVYLPAGPGLPGLHDMHPAKRVIKTTSVPPATKRLNSRFFIAPV